MNASYVKPERIEKWELHVLCQIQLQEWTQQPQNSGHSLLEITQIGQPINMADNEVIKYEFTLTSAGVGIFFFGMIGFR